MRITRRTWIGVATHFGAAAAGAALVAVVGANYWRDSVAGLMAMTDLTVAGHYGSLLDMERETGDDREYERALRQYLVVLDNLLDPSRHSSVESTLALEKTVALARLGLLVESHARTNEANELFTAAVAQCQTFRKGDCSANSVRDWAAYFERRNRPNGGK